MPMSTDGQGVGPRRSTSMLRDYQKANFWRRLMLAAFFTTFASTLFWAIPIFPWGLSASDYTDRLQFLVFLLLLESMTAFGAVYLRDVTHRFEQTLLTWNTVHDGLGDLRRREYLYDRIVIECDSAKRNHGEFVVVALRIDDESEAQEGENIERALRALATTVRETDCLAALGPHEIGVLAPRVSTADAPAFAERLRRLLSVATIDPEKAVVRAGWAIYGSDGIDAGELVGVARDRLAGREAHALAEDYPAAAA